MPQRFEDIIPDDVKAKVAERTARFRATGNEAIRADRSEGLGFTALILTAPPDMLEALRHNVRVANTDPENSYTLHELERQADYTPQVALRAERGIFWYVEGGSMDKVMFGVDATTEGDAPRLLRARYDLTIPAVHVSRIVGDMGEEWQNPYPNDMMSLALFDSTASSF